MSGLFLNFYQIKLSRDDIKLRFLDYQNYNSKESFIELRDKNPNIRFYRHEDKLLYWSNESILLQNSNDLKTSKDESPKVFSKIFEFALVDFLKSSLSEYRIFKNRYSNTWEVISPKDLLKGQVDGLEVNRVVRFTPYFFNANSEIILGFTLSTSVKNNFKWTKQRFEQEGIDTKGLKGKDDIIYANRESIKRFLESKGSKDIYDEIIKREGERTTSYDVLSKFFNWLNTKKNEIVLPEGLKVEDFSKRYLPFENDLVKSELIYRPERFFYSNQKNTQNLRYYDQMVKAYKPYSLELYQNKEIQFSIVCPKEFQGETESFLKKIEGKLKEIFHFQKISFNLISITGTGLEAYKSALYDDSLLKSDLVYIILTKEHEKLKPSLSPYHVCKAKLIGNGIPTQDIQIETIRQNATAFIMSNISLNTYAKLGGTAWTIEREEKIREELVIGIGSTIGKDGQHVLGIAQIFHNDGRYIMGDCAPLSTFENYAKNLEVHLFETLKPLVSELKSKGTFRLIFHLYKSASEEYEIKAINNLQERFSEYDIEFALVHLGYGHNFRLYYNDGKNEVKQGIYVQLNKHSALLNFVKESDLPLKIDLDKRSTFTSLFYLAKQVYWFSHLSHRSYMPAKRTVTIMYPSLMAKMTEELKKVDGWDYERLKALSEKLWFI